jgi:hypothetical protein
MLLIGPFALVVLPISRATLISLAIHISWALWVSDGSDSLWGVAWLNRRALLGFFNLYQYIASGFFLRDYGWDWGGPWNSKAGRCCADTYFLFNLVNKSSIFRYFYMLVRAAIFMGSILSSTTKDTKIRGGRTIVSSETGIIVRRDK